MATSDDTTKDEGRIDRRSYLAALSATAAGSDTKTWLTTSGNPRSAHAALNGQTVPIDQRFSNGMRWPGDPAGGGENNANCRCVILFDQ